ncbi:type IV secretory system conjugative DNA transfer family protein, partial [Streptomyces coeruleorubidus]|uniref:type IV secretory system conjugative DNA transfer family protein n=1 Tax=Streptomyces coeruleorubidus TaxID=116188 RepID=UPI0033BBE79C
GATTPRRTEPTAPRRAEPASPASLFGQERVGGWEKILVAPRESRQTTATQAVRDAEGPALVVTSNPALWQETKDARAKLGPTHLYDPTHLCDTPSRLHWSPTAGCEDRETATARATALLTPVRPTAKLDQAVSDTATTLLRSYLHAAAIDGRTIRHVHRWSQGTQIQDAVRILRTNPKAAPGSAGELEGALTAHPERRDMAQQLTTRALAALSTVNIREACTPNRTDALALDSFVHEGGTLYVVGESIEDPRTNPGAMPLLTALVSSVVERGRRMAERSSSGRLDPPFTLVLDDVAAVAPLPQLPELLATGADRGMPTLALLRSREQGRARWPHDELPV